MNRLLIAIICLSTLGCYTPRGVFLEVDDGALSGDLGYLISAGDVLLVRVFQQEAMSARVKVRGDGKVSLPLINDVIAAGKSPTVLATELQARLKDFINNPVVTVSLEESRPVVVSVVGEVVRPGVVTLEPGAGVLQALAASGGLTDFAHRDGLFVLRRHAAQPQPKRLRFTWEVLARGEGPAARFTLLPGDVVIAE
jgi:polysaccharide biosynthesis/export protein